MQPISFDSLLTSSRRFQQTLDGVEHTQSVIGGESVVVGPRVARLPQLRHITAVGVGELLGEDRMPLVAHHLQQELRILQVDRPGPTHPTSVDALHARSPTVTEPGPALTRHERSQTPPPEALSPYRPCRDSKSPYLILTTRVRQSPKGRSHGPPNGSPCQLPSRSGSDIRMERRAHGPPNGSPCQLPRIITTIGEATSLCGKRNVKLVICSTVCVYCFSFEMSAVRCKPTNGRCKPTNGRCKPTTDGAGHQRTLPPHQQKPKGKTWKTRKLCRRLNLQGCYADPLA